MNLPKVENFSQLFLKEKLSGAKAEPAKAELVQSESRTAEKRPAKSAQSEGSKRTRQAANGRAKAPKEKGSKEVPAREGAAKSTGRGRTKAEPAKTIPAPKRYAAKSAKKETASTAEPAKQKKKSGAKSAAKAPAKTPAKRGRAGVRNGKQSLSKVTTSDVEIAPLAPTVSLAGEKRGGKTPRGKLKIIPLGGIEEIGKNLTVIEYEDDIILIDCGLMFPDDEMLGIDLVIPDITYLVKNASKIRGIVITHGHEDHIGALPYVLRQLNVPVYGTRMTLGILKNKLTEAGLASSAKLFLTRPGDVVKLGCFKVEFIESNHSIPDAVMLAIHTPLGILVHTGDFKIDSTPIIGEMVDLARLGQLGREGVLALMSDSTNAERSGYTMSERNVGETFDSIFKSCQSRIIIATFASNIHRIQQILDAAKKYGRKVAVSGRSMVNNVETAISLGVIKPPENVLIDIEMIKRYKDDQLVIITTGSQGETMSALYRMARSDHRQIQIVPGDLIVVSASPIPGNEKSVSNVINDLFKLGANVIYKSLAEVHVSGHACQEEQKLILALTKPKFFIPVHGEYRMLRKHMQTALAVGIPEKNVLIPQLGKTIELDRESIKLGAAVPSGKVLIDGLGVGDVGNIVIRDRKILSEDGVIVVVATLDRATSTLQSGPDIVSRGFIYVREAEQIMDDMKKVAYDAFCRCEDSRIKDWSAIKTNVKDALSNYIYAATGRRPMILPILMEL